MGSCSSVPSTAMKREGTDQKKNGKGKVKKPLELTELF